MAPCSVRLGWILRRRCAARPGHHAPARLMPVPDDDKRLGISPTNGALKGVDIGPIDRAEKDRVFGLSEHPLRRPGRDAQSELRKYSPCDDVRVIGHDERGADYARTFQDVICRE